MIISSLARSVLYLRGSNVGGGNEGPYVAWAAVLAPSLRGVGGAWACPTRGPAARLPPGAAGKRGPPGCAARVLGSHQYPIFFQTPAHVCLDGQPLGLNGQGRGPHACVSQCLFTCE